MITVHAGTSVIVSNAFGEFLYPVGVWVVSDVHSLRPGTNAYVQLNLRDGSYVSVDTVGGVDVVEAGNVGAAAIQGFVVGFGVIGLVVLLRWIVRLFGNATHGIE